MKADSSMITWLLEESGITPHTIAKDIGVNKQSIYNLANGDSKMGNITFELADALTEYADKIMKEEGIMKIWQRNGYTVQEREFDYDLHKFVIVVDGEDDAEIVPDDQEAMQEIINQLDAGEEAVGMADGKGGEIELPYYMIETENQELKKRGKDAFQEVFTSYSRKEALAKYQMLNPDEGERMIVSTVYPNRYIEWISEKDYMD